MDSLLRIILTLLKAWLILLGFAMLVGGGLCAAILSPWAYGNSGESGYVVLALGIAVAGFFLLRVVVKSFRSKPDEPPHGSGK